VARAFQGRRRSNIRSTVNTDSRVLADQDSTFIDSLNLFWQDKPPPGVILDPAKEQQRLREAQVSGQQPTGATPTIERRKRGLLEGDFLSRPVVIRRRAVLGGLWGGVAAGALVSRRASATTKLLTVVRRPAETFTLANGLQVVSAGVQARPADQPDDGLTRPAVPTSLGPVGRGAFLEHMMFKGTSTVPSGDFLPHRVA